MQIVRAGVAAAALLLCAGAAFAQPISVRVEHSAANFTPLHSYAVGEIEGDIVFVAGISGMGLHNASQNGTQVGFPVNVFNRFIYLYQPATDTLHVGALDHLSDDVKEALLVTNPAHLTHDDVLYVFGGYGPTLAGDNWTTRATQTSIDLAAVRDALLNGQPVPASAFSVAHSADSQLAGAKAIDMGDKFVLIGGAIFTGDYGRAGTASFTEQYTIKVNVFDKQDKLSPLQTFGQTAAVPSQDRLRRRDMNALPATLPAEDGGASRGHGFAVLGGVFRQAAFGWVTPLTHRAGDASIAHHTGFTQHMNQYEGPAASFYSAANDQNRFLLFSGISGYTWDGENFVNTNATLFNIPWTAEITELTMDAGAFVSETVKGVMPTPIVNGELIVNEHLPRAANGQILLDELPPAEIRLGSIYGGLRAVMPGVTPPTYPSGGVYDVYIVVGVRGDITGDGVVGAADLAAMLGAWGSGSTRADLNLDGVVNAADLASLLGTWGNNTPG